ncbi:MAG: hypothetical protein ACPGD5_02815 [Salibacteraceae bacterium]
MSQIKAQSYIMGDLSINRNSPNYPSRSDEKIMRQDVKASILIINEMIESAGLQKNIVNVPLYVANGAFVENVDRHLNRIVNVYKTIEQGSNEAEKIRKIYRASPPLVALETLTNSTMSFIAQYTGIKGNNATFGNTSISAIHAIQEAENALQDTPLAIVNSSNCSGDYSYLTNSSVLGYDEHWKESTGVACLLLGNEEGGSQNSLAKICSVKNSFKIPNIETKGIKRNWVEIMIDDGADALVHSGAYSLHTHEKDVEYSQNLNSSSFSWFDSYGNMGPSNVVFGIIKAVNFIEEGAQVVDVLDRDVFGRESLIRIEKC